MLELRSYQRDAIRSLYQAWKEDDNCVPLLVCPTGSGKSLIIAELVRALSEQRPTYTALIVSHRKEIIEQNAQAISELSGVQVGVYSAGLGRKEMRKITCANIQSIFRRELAEIKLLIIDECHLISGRDDSMYEKLINQLRSRNPKLKIVGLTATPYRLDRGSLIAEDSLFTDICYDISLIELIKDGYLTPLISKQSKIETDLTQVRLSGYDFNQGDLQLAYDVDPIIQAQVTEIIEQGQSRNHWLVFSSGVLHAQHLAEAFQHAGIVADYVTGEMLDMVRDLKLSRFKNGEIQCLVNCDILTTGFNFPAVDLIALIRATKSVGLYVQILGRGMRPAPNKKNCLVLDYGGNIKRHGPIDCIRVKSKTKKTKPRLSLFHLRNAPLVGLLSQQGALFVRRATKPSHYHHKNRRLIPLQFYQNQKF